MIDYRLGNVDAVLDGIPDETVQVVVTSPPYFGLRAYDGGADEIGQEDTPEAFVARLVAVFRKVRRVLRKDGVLFLNLGDSWCSTAPGTQGDPLHARGVLAGVRAETAQARARMRPATPAGLKPKDMIGIPWRVALALQADGWYLRQDMVWCLSGGAWVYAQTKKGEMPCMVKDLVRLDPATVRLWNGRRWTQVTAWSEVPDSGAHEIVLRSGERVGCTDNHQWPTQRGNVRACDLKVGDVLRTCSLPDSSVSMPAYLTDDALWLIGLFLAEGSQGNTASSLRLSLAADELLWVPRIKAVAKHYGGSCSHQVHGNSLTVALGGAVLTAVVQTYVGGVDALTKHLKVATWSLPNAALRKVIEGYLDGDGSYEAKNERWRLGFCRNYALERDLRVAAARLDATLTLIPATAHYQGGEKPSFRGEWRWLRSGHGNEKDRGEVVEIRASRARHFWDISVADEPHLFALASGVLTHNSKTSCMPESVTDRFTKSHEYIFLLSKSERYFFDHVAVREPVAASTRARLAQNVAAQKGSERVPGKTNGTMKAVGDGETRNRRSVWALKLRGLGNRRNRRSVLFISPKGFKGAHFAVYPPEIPEIAIKAGTSAHGACTTCGAPWKRRTGRPCKACGAFIPTQGKACGSCGHVNDWKAERGVSAALAAEDWSKPGRATPRKLGASGKQGAVPAQEQMDQGWAPTCRCGTSTVRPCVVLDPFGGSGTTSMVAERLGRDSIYIDLNPDYLALAMERWKLA